MQRTVASLAAVNGIINEMTRPGTSRSYNNLAITHEMVRRLGLQRELQRLRFIHVAGTKGKGSTCFATAHLLKQAGLRVGLFTSPHLVDVRERCTIDLELIDETRFTQYFTSFKAEHDAAFDAAPWETDMKPDGTPGSLPQKSAFFRFMFLLSLRIFAEEAVDVVVCEVGVGGRIDSTNVIASSVSGITALGMDHMDLLGDTVLKIAGEKAGIIKPNVPVFTSPQSDYPETLAVIEAAAAKVGAPLAIVQPDWFNGIPPHATAEQQRQQEDLWAAVRARGSHMVENSKLALALARTFRGVDVASPATTDELAALSRSAYPGRSQVVPGAIEGVEFYLDGAHTPESTRVAAKWFFDIAAAASSPTAETTAEALTSVIFFSSRDAHELLRALVPYADRIGRLVFVRFDHDSKALPRIPASKLHEMREAWTLIISEEEAKRGADDATVVALKRVVATVVEEPLADYKMLADAARVVVTSSSSCNDGAVAASAAVPVTKTLLTGSLYLIGAALDMLKPALQARQMQQQ